MNVLIVSCKFGHFVLSNWIMSDVHKTYGNDKLRLTNAFLLAILEHQCDIAIVDRQFILFCYDCQSMTLLKLWQHISTQRLLFFYSNLIEDFLFCFNTIEMTRINLHKSTWSTYQKNSGHSIDVHQRNKKRWETIPFQMQRH